MRELKYKKPFWYAVLAAGGGIALASAALIVRRIVSGSAAVIPIAMLAAAACGGGYLIYLALRAIRQIGALPEQTAAAPKSKREQAALALSEARSGVDRRFANTLSAVILILCSFVFLWAFGKAQKTEAVPQSTVLTGIFYEKAAVLSIDDSQYQGQQDVEDVPIGSQMVTVEITTGQFKGNTYRLKNNLSYLYGTVLKEGDAVTVSFSMTDGEVESLVLQDYDRTVPLVIVILAFLVITVLVGGKVGAKSLLGLGLTILCVFAILIPMLLGGSPTIPTILWICAFVTVVEFVILGGVNKKTVCAILGTMSGVAFAALFGQIACALTRVNGFQMYVANPEIEALLQIKQGQDPFYSLQIGDLLVGGILIAALGAVNDVAMSISSAMNELKAVNPNLTRKELFRSGMNIGRDMVGTMTNTLILALVGSALVLMIYLSSLAPSFRQLMSTAFLSVEMVQALASSVGVILAVPMSVLIGMLLFGRRQKKAK
ncbi:MAG: YibE/F family protein [Oscillospiraceae bacterium]|nr:YibE/F family protein [Oscillospiraceae bacterium]